ncbi:MAG: cation transporter [Chthoniobacterales bacterium]
MLQAIRLEIVTVVWMVVEALGAVVAAWFSRSLLLLAFGIDSGIELISAVVLLWRLRQEAFAQLNQSEGEKVERRAARLAGWLLYMLAIYVTLQAAYSLWGRNSADTSFLGMGIAVVAALGMPILAKAKLRVADQIQSRALRADAMETLTCGYLAWVLLAGLLANALVHWWWIDSVASLAIVPLLLREAKEALSGSCRSE